MTLTLLRLDPAEVVQTPELPVVIGRSDNVHVFVGCRWASRQHCQIDHVNGRFVLRDLGSRYGTMVNGELVQEVTLKPGDEIGIGLNRFIVKLPEESATTARSEER